MEALFSSFIFLKLIKNCSVFSTSKNSSNYINFKPTIFQIIIEKFVFFFEETRLLIKLGEIVYFSLLLGVTHFGFVLLEISVLLRNAEVFGPVFLVMDPSFYSFEFALAVF